MKAGVSVHLNSWAQQLAHFIDISYLRLERYERQVMWREARLCASRRKLQTPPETERYLTLKQKSKFMRDHAKEVGERFLPYFVKRIRVRPSAPFFASCSSPALIMRLSLQRMFVRE